jgi:phosphate transport system permease protein
MAGPSGNSQSSAGSATLPSRERRAGRSSVRFNRLLDAVFRLLCQGAAWLIIVLSALLLLVLVWQAWLAIVKLGAGFFVGQTWDPVPGEKHEKFGALPFIWGTLTTSAIALLIAIPLGVGTAAFLSEIAPGWLRKTGAFFVEMLAAVPSVVYGFWGVFVLAPVLRVIFTALGGPNDGGFGIVPAGLILSIMIVPYIAAVSYDVCRAVPRAQREASLALGATRWQTIWRVVLPYARPGIIGGCFLALGRALGETMAVTMLIGNRPVISASPFALGNSIASVIANEFMEAVYSLHRSALVELGLVLLLVSVIVNSLARLLIRRVSRIGPRRSVFGAIAGLWRRRAALPPAAPLAADATAPLAPLSGRPLPVSLEKARWINRLMTGVLGLCLAITVSALFLILGHLIFQGVGALNWDFFVKLPVPMGEPGGGLANALYGSLLLVGLATLFAVPVGVLAAIYLAEYRSDRLGPAVRFIGELLSGVPSIVIGLFSYYAMVQPLSHLTGGHVRFCAWAGAFALGVIMIPIVMRASEEALKLVPQSIRSASYALGASRYQTVLRVVVPAALPAIITAVFLAIARIGGETAPLLLTAGGNQFWPTSPNDFTPSLPVYIFEYAKSSDRDQNRQAWAAALVLLTAVMLLNFGVRFLTGKRVMLASRAE